MSVYNKCRRPGADVQSGFGTDIFYEDIFYGFKEKGVE